MIEFGRGDGGESWIVGGDLISEMGSRSDGSAGGERSEVRTGSRRGSLLGEGLEGRRVG